MSRIRQSARDRTKASRAASAPHGGVSAPEVGSGDESLPVSAVSADVPGGHVFEPHRHRRAQLVYAVEGVMTVETDEGLWVVPPLRAVWVPPGVAHSIRMTGRVRMRTVYFAPARIAHAKTPPRPQVVTVSPLMRELIVRIVDTVGVAGVSERAESANPENLDRIADLLLDELTAAPVGPLEIPVPSDPRLRRITDALRKDPSDARDQPSWAKLAGMSERTLARTFLEQTGLPLVRWRQQVRLLRALERLAIGESVTTVTMDLGYGSVSAFVKLFRDNFGVTPGRYFDR